MRDERKYFEINEDTAVYDNDKLVVTIPSEYQSNEGVDLYFNKEYLNGKNLVATSVSIAPAPLNCFWNWFMSMSGTPEYEAMPTTGTVDISKYTISGIPGAFGFSGKTPDSSDITITFTISN